MLQLYKKQTSRI